MRLFPGLTSFENVEVAALSTGASRRVARALAGELLTSMRLEHRRDLLAAALPHDDERRLAVARALAARPSFLLLDEPAAGLTDAESDDLVAALRVGQHAVAPGVLVIEHDMRLIMGLCDRIQVLDQGRTIAVGNPAQVRDDPAVRAAYLGTAATADGDARDT